MIEQRTVMREVRREVLYLPGDAGDRIYLLKRGVVKISVSMALSDFRRRGLVVLEGRAFRLPRPQSLQELQ